MPNVRLFCAVSSVTSIALVSGMSSQIKNATMLRVEHLSWTAPSRGLASPVKILDDVSFKIEKGKFVGLIGPNGAGKSSLMRCVYRVTKPSEGEVFVDEQNVWELSAKQSALKTAVILQEQNDYMGLSVHDVIAQGLTPHKGLFEWNTRGDDALIAQLLKEMELSELAEKPFSVLSGGEKQRAYLARALLQKPQLLIMDEPTNHLDIHFQLEVLRKVKALPVTVFASFHDLNLAAAFCDEIIVLNHGKLCAQGSPEDVLKEDLISEVYRTCCVVDRHPLYDHPRVSFAFQYGVHR